MVDRMQLCTVHARLRSFIDLFVTDPRTLCAKVPRPCKVLSFSQTEKKETFLFWEHSSSAQCVHARDLFVWNTNSYCVLTELSSMAYRSWDIGRQAVNATHAFLFPGDNSECSLHTTGNTTLVIVQRWSCQLKVGKLSCIQRGEFYPSGTPEKVLGDDSADNVPTPELLVCDLEICMMLAWKACPWGGCQPANILVIGDTFDINGKEAFLAVLATIVGNFIETSAPENARE